MRFAVLLTFFAATAQAQDLALTCSGSDPAWSLTLNDSTAHFSFQRDSDLALMLTTTPQDRDWPKALTYVGRGDSVIAIIDDAACQSGTGTHSATLLTQRGQTPLMVVGCCSVQ